MADLRINDIEPQLRDALKMQAILHGRTLRDHVLYILRKAVRKAA